MAKKKVARRKPQPSQPVPRIQGTLKKLQRDAEAVLGRVRKEAVRLSHDQKKSLDRVVSEAQRLRGDFQKAVKHTSKDLESRSRQFFTTLEKEADKRLQPVLKGLVGRMGQSSRQELERLSRRITELEQLVKQHMHPETPAAPPQAPAAKVDIGPTPDQES